MSTVSTRRVISNFSGDTVAQMDESAANNSLSPGEIRKQILSAGNNTITVPTNATAVTILPPAGNTSTITLKGIAGDTGIALHLTDPTSVGLGSAVATFVLNAVTQVTVILVWS